MNHERAKELLERQFEERALAPLQQEALRIHLRQCDSCRREYNRYVALERSLEGVTTPRAQIERLLTELPEAEERTTERPWNQRFVGAVLALAAAVLLGVFVFQQPKANLHDFGVRSAGGEGPASWIRIFAKAKEAKVTPLTKTISRREGLLFAYTNLRRSKATFLVIAGRDAKGRVHWYHPAYESASDNPVSLSIKQGVDQELGEIVYAKHALGPLEICAFFTTAQLRVKQVDAEAEKTGTWPDIEQRDCHQVTVTP